MPFPMPVAHAASAQFALFEIGIELFQLRGEIDVRNRQNKSLTIPSPTGIDNLYALPCPREFVSLFS